MSKKDSLPDEKVGGVFEDWQNSSAGKAAEALREKQDRDRSMQADLDADFDDGTGYIFNNYGTGPFLAKRKRKIVVRAPDSGERRSLVGLVAGWPGVKVQANPELSLDSTLMPSRGLSVDNKDVKYIGPDEKTWLHVQERAVRQSIFGDVGGSFEADFTERDAHVKIDTRVLDCLLKRGVVFEEEMVIAGRTVHRQILPQPTRPLAVLKDIVLSW